MADARTSVSGEGCGRACSSVSAVVQVILSPNAFVIQKHDRFEMRTYKLTALLTALYDCLDRWGTCLGREPKALSVIREPLKSAFLASHSGVYLSILLQLANCSRGNQAGIRVSSEDHVTSSIWRLDPRWTCCRIDIGTSVTKVVVGCSPFQCLREAFVL